MNDVLAAFFQGGIYFHNHYSGDKVAWSELWQQDSCPAFLVEVVSPATSLPAAPFSGTQWPQQSLIKSKLWR